MKVKWQNFKHEELSYIDCIPAAGEAVRINWFQKRHEKRKKIILQLKRGKKNWKKPSGPRKISWQKLRQFHDRISLCQLSNIRRTELGMYTRLEIKWINKTFRTLRQRSQDFHEEDIIDESEILFEFSESALA